MYVYYIRANTRGFSHEIQPFLHLKFYSLDEEIAIALKELAQSSHKTASQWVTDKVWEEKKKEDKENVSDQR